MAEQITENPTSEMPEESEAIVPTAQEMLDRLDSIDLKEYDMEAVFTELKGKRVWVSAMTIPASAIILGTFTLLGMLLFDQPIIAFIVGALLLFWIAKMIDASDHKFRFLAHQEVLDRIKNTEGEFGLIPHFKHFLPERYRHLWQSLRRGNYQYIEQYIQAVHLLQNKMDPDKFTHIWHLTHPELDSSEELHNVEEISEPNHK